ncbi:MAG: HD-GYP domain-containing protein [Nitrospirota bacterium]|jgi:HD-GYP domain-containing protein (c-di-GMP phosphodiesterase class II)
MEKAGFREGIFRTINTTRDIRKAAFIAYDAAPHAVVESVLSVLYCEHVVLSAYEDIIAFYMAARPDVLFIGPADASRREEQFLLCQGLREFGYEGIIILVTDDPMACGGTPAITSEGFDSYVLSSDSPSRILDTVEWAIINRRRRNKFTIQFDGNPDSFYTVDAAGRVYDLNRGATEGTPYSPKDVVCRGIGVMELGTLSFFPSRVQPRIRPEYVGMSFDDTVEEGECICQVRTTVHNVSTIGLVATVAKTDITRAVYHRTLDILVNSVTLLSHRDNYTAAHSARVFHYASSIAEAMGVARNRRFMRSLSFAALLHDIGKIGIKDNILLKKGKLTPGEYAELSTHPVKGFRMLRSYSLLGDAGELVRSHHERPDGSGYPDKLVGNKIPLGASIIAVADGFDAMTTTRPYRKSLSYDAALREMRQNLGSQYNAEACTAFLSLITFGLMRAVRRKSRLPLSDIAHTLLKTIL